MTPVLLFVPEDTADGVEPRRTKVNDELGIVY